MIDLHMHTMYSDGSKSVEELLKMCEEKNLEYIAITDHNTCEAYYDNAFINNIIYTGTIIKGCELNARFQNRAIEILGYKIDTDVIMEWRKKYYSKEAIQENTKIIYNRFISILDKKGIIYEKEKIRKQKNLNEFIERPIMEEIKKHPENREIMGTDNFDIEIKQFFRKEITNPESDYFLNRVDLFPSAEEVVDIIHKAGGKAFLAHPFEYQFNDTIKYIDDLKNEVELDGIECFHPSATQENSKQLIEYANKNNLLKSGGSDYHGATKPDIEIAVGRGDMHITKEFIEDWI